jgi:hypothetical protein
MLSFAYKRFEGVVPEPGELDEEDRALLVKEVPGGHPERVDIPAGKLAALGILDPQSRSGPAAVLRWGPILRLDAPGSLPGPPPVATPQADKRTCPANSGGPQDPEPRFLSQ